MNVGKKNLDANSTLLCRNNNLQRIARSDILLQKKSYIKYGHVRPLVCFGKITAKYNIRNNSYEIRDAFTKELKVKAFMFRGLKFALSWESSGSLAGRRVVPFCVHRFTWVNNINLSRSVFRIKETDVELLVCVLFMAAYNFRCLLK